MYPNNLKDLIKSVVLMITIQSLVLYVLVLVSNSKNKKIE